MKSHKLINIVVCSNSISICNIEDFRFLFYFFSCFLFLFFLFFNTQTFEEKEHFSTYALNSKTGATHWKHEPGDYEVTKNSREVLLRLKMSLITRQIFSPKSIVFGLWSVCTASSAIACAQTSPISFVARVQHLQHLQRFTVILPPAKTPPKKCPRHHVIILRYKLTQSFTQFTYLSFLSYDFYFFVKPQYKSILLISITIFFSSWWRFRW